MLGNGPLGTGNTSTAAATSIQGVPIASTTPVAMDALGFDGAQWTPVAANDLLDTIPVAGGGTGAENAGDARTNLGLAIGSNVQAHNALLAAIAGLGANGYMQRTGAGSASASATIPAADIAAGTAGISISGNAAGLSSTLAIASGGTGLTAATVGAGVATASGVLVSNGSAFSVAPITGKQVSPTLAFATIATTGRNGAGAVTWSGVKVGDIVLMAVPIAGAAFPASIIQFESTITVADQIQQSTGIDASGITFAFLALRQS